ncbi:GNAT family N-acetyltransferase [Vibrio hangzhouensis]|uniref:GNAT family N-acetyltransferase n=1 Tax=Vibrio hangzhouensis TaxID=462991 RepID=UPI001C967CD6|nr:GNAT family N-acetyltransferase [Vibrio hangzhouensis]MBY6198177.1 GNAT family N-acetyltransferase [Vibrio hangzhouensis]
MIISNTLEPGDLGHIVKQHGLLYGYDFTFEAYVAEPLAQFAKRNSNRERIWLARLNGELVGTICICENSTTEAQLRWFLVDPKARGKGLGKTLIEQALNFCIAENYSKVILWTVAGLAASKSLYIKNGFQLIHEQERELWGQAQLEQCYEKYL